MNRTSLKSLRGLFFLCVVLLAIPAYARDWRISDFAATYSVDKTGGVFVIERITFVFIGSFQGIYRTIPVEYPGPRGTNYSLFLKVASVTDDQGRSLKYESKREGAYRKLKVYIPGAQDTSKTIVISYSAPNATRFFDDHNEFYWNVTGNDWPVPIDHATAFVQFPQTAASGLRAQAFTGVYGSHDQEAEATVEGAQVRFEITNPLPMRGGLTIDIYMPKGAVEQPGALTRANWFIRGNPGIFIPIWAFVVMFLFWYYKGRDPDPGLSVAPMYEPPKGLTPAEVGTLVDDRTDPRDITSTLVDLAVKGYVRIRETKQEGFFFDSKDYEFDLLKPSSEFSKLSSHEQVMLTNLFGGGSQTTLSSLKNRFYTALPVMRQDIKAQLKAKGMYLVDPDSAHALTIFAVILIAAPFAALQFLGAISLFDSPTVTIGGGILALIFVLIFGRNMSAKTILGGRTRVHILGLQEFMNRVDKDRLQRMPPDTFEKFLPFAMALGVEQRWAQAFAGIMQNPPTWYQPYGGYSGMNFNSMMFTHNMSRLTSEAQNVFVSAPRSSSSGSGFGGGGFSSGGGFSGGGFGGGGGGAF
ncbi:MAG TPA: DUF2207 domain-containing protein [Terriglobales bacterium]|nr:DUF2207 domain-containing protein [Terriglobales bacterium]